MFKSLFLLFNEHIFNFKCYKVIINIQYEYVKSVEMQASNYVWDEIISVIIWFFDHMKL